MRYFLFVFFLILFSCQDPEGFTFVELDSYSLIDTSEKVYVLNEGNFNWANASLSQYTPGEKMVTNDYYKSIEQIGIGDVLNSSRIYDDILYLVVNNSGKIERINLTNNTVLSAFEGFISPRFVCEHEENLYVSDLYSDDISLVDITSGEVLSKIKTGGWTEQMISFANRLFVINKDKNQIQVIENENIVDSASVNEQPNSMIVDNIDRLWVLSDGGLNGEASPSLKVFKLPALTKVLSVNLPKDTYPTRLCISPEKNFIYFLNKDVYRLNIQSLTSLPEVIIEANGKNFYGMDVSPTGDIYVSDAWDYLSNGRVYRYSEELELIDEFEVGIIPGYFQFQAD